MHQCADDNKGKFELVEAKATIRDLYLIRSRFYPDKLNLQLLDQRIYASFPATFVQKFLVKKGWQRRSGTQKGFDVWIRRNDLGHEIATPMLYDETYPDYGKSVCNILQLTSELQNRDFWEILIDLVTFEGR